MTRGPLVHSLTFPNATSAPATPGSGELSLYAESNVLKAKDSTGTVTPLQGATGATGAQGASGAAGAVLYWSSTDVPVTGTTSETTLATAPIPDQDPGTVVRFRAQGTMNNNTGSNQSPVFTLKFGATTVFTWTIAGTTASVNDRRWFIEAELLVVDDTHQEWVTRGWQGNPLNAVISSQISALVVGVNATTVTHSASVNLVLTATLPSATNMTTTLTAVYADSGAASGTGVYTAGDGLTLTGSDFDVNTDGTTIEVAADALQVKAGGISNSHVNAAAAIAVSKLALVAGAALVLTGDTLDVGVDGSTIEVNADALRVKAGGISDSHINAAAAIATSKLALVAGNGLGLATDTLSVNVDDTGIEINTDTLRLKDGGVTSAKIADGTIVNADVNGSAAIATSKLALVAGAALTLTGDTLDVAVDGTGIEVNADALRLKDGGVTSAKIADGTIVNADINGSAAIALSKLATDPLARANHTGTQTASTISDLATVVQAYRLDQFAAPNTSVGMGSQRITSVADPTSGQDAATKNYVDLMAGGLDPKGSVRAASTGNLTLSGTQTIDGVSVIANERVLAKDQSSGAENGIYVVAAGAWARAADANVSAEVTGGMYVWVNEGTANGDTGWALTTNDPITLDTTALVFTQVTGLGQITAGAALTKTGATLDVAVDGATIEVNADALRVKALGISNSHINASAAIAVSKLALVAGAALVLTGDTLDVGVDGATIEVNADALRVKAAGISNSHINAAAAIDLSKTALVAGAALTLTGNTLDTAVDGTTLEVNADALRVKALGISDSHINAAAAIAVSKTALVAGAGLALSTNTLDVNVDAATIEINADTLRVKDGGLGVAKLSATGTPSATTYLRGDNTWGTPAGGGGSFDPLTTDAWLAAQFWS